MASRPVTLSLLLLLLAMPSPALADGPPPQPYGLFGPEDGPATFHLDARDYFFVYAPSGPSRALFEQGNASFELLEPRLAGGTTVRPPAAGPVTITVAGGGTFAVVDGTLTNNLHVVREEQTVQPVGGRYAWALARDASPSHFCLEAAGGFTWALRDESHAVLRAGSAAPGERVDVEVRTEGIYQLLFVEGLHDEPLRVVLDEPPCDEQRDAPGAAVGLLAAAVLVAALARRRR